MGDLVFDFSTTQDDFVVSKEHIVQLLGPMGEGKTHAGVAGCTVHAKRCGYWTSKLAEEPDGEYARFEDPHTGKIDILTKRTFNILPGENKYLSGLARAANRAAFIDDPGKFVRYVEGQIARVNRGKKVTPKYNPAIHFSPVILPVNKGELITMWDGFHHPTCTLCQYIPTGKLEVHDVVEDDMLTAVAELCPDKLDPLLNSPKYRGKVISVRTLCDESMATPGQSTRNQSEALVVVDYPECRPRGWPIAARPTGSNRGRGQSPARPAQGRPRLPRRDRPARNPLDGLQGPAGYLVALSWFFTFTGLVAALIIVVVINPAKLGETITAMGNMMTSKAMLWSVVLSVLGITVAKRIKDKETAAGVIAAPGFLQAWLNRKN